MVRNLILFTLTILVMLGCSQERPEEYTQGQGQSNLWSVSDFQNKYFTVKTGNALIEKKATEADSLKLGTGEESYARLNNFDLVSYTTNSTLLKDVPFRGKANSTYQVRYKVTKDYLIIMKVAKKELLPTQEQIVATQIPGSDLFEVPLIGYPIALVNVENILDSNGDKTSKLAEYGSAELATANHFRIDRTSRKLFSADEKNDVFPKDLFEGEWFYAATVVSASADNSDMIGRDLSVDSEQAYVSRIKFINTVNSVIGMNVNMDENIDDTDEINANTAIEIPIEWVDFRVAKIGKDSVLREETLGDGHVEARHWSKRDYMKISFAYTKAGFGINSAGVVLNPKFQNLEITNNFISFMIYYPDSGVRVKYALKKAPKTPKKGRVYFKEDRTKFGFFLTNKQFIRNHKYYYRNDFDRQTLLNRFYPDNGKIEYRFTHTTPVRFREAARKAAASWNEVFKIAGTGYEVVINEEEDVDLGDIRYNIMNIVDTKDGARLLGYGPSIADTKSGEIVSATTNVYVNPFRDGLADKLRKYIRFRLGMYSSASAVGTSASSATSSDVEKTLEFYEDITHSDNFADLNESAQKAFESSKAFFVQNNKNQIEALHKHQEKIENNQTKENFHEHKFGEKCNFQTHSHDVINRIESHCTETFLPYVKELVAMGITHDERELEMLNTCIEKLIDEDILATLVHEMGHNLGLRHNFSASNDPANFYKPEETNGILVKTASTMDYNNGQSHELLKPGLYDLAAIRFGYANSVETVDGDIVKINANKSLSENIKDKRLDLRQFNFCTDEHVGDKDPLCNRWDYGQNPSEVVDATIAFYHSLYATYGHKLDRAYGPLQAQFDNNVVEKVLIPLKQIYEHWRYLLTKYIKKTHQHLEMYSAKEFEQILEDMKNSNDVHGQNYAQYFEASEKAYNFLKQLVTMTARYCVTQDADNNVTQLNYVDFETIRTEVYKASNVTIFDCDDSAALDYFADNNERLIRTVGNYFNGVSQSLNPYDEIETYYLGGEPHELLEISGTAGVKAMAMAVLALRNPTLKLGQKENNTTNFLDDPRHRADMINILATQALLGTSTKDLATDDLEQRYVPLFRLEQHVKQATFQNLLQGIAVPGNHDETLKRFTIFKPLVTSVSMASSIPAGAVTTQLENTIYYATQDRILAYNMINKINELMSLNEMKSTDVLIPTVEQVLNSFQGKITLIKKDDLAKMTLEQLGEALKAIKNQVNALQDPTEKQIASIILEEELQIAMILEQAGEQAAPYAQMNAIEVLITVVGIPADQITFYEEAITTRIEQFIENQKAVKANAENFQKNAYEYQAQLNMLRTIIRTMAGA